MVLDGLAAVGLVTLEGLDENENIVHPDGQHEEWNDFDDDERGGEAAVAVEADGCAKRGEHDQDSRETQGYFGVDQAAFPVSVLPQRQGDIDEHDEVAQKDRGHVGLTFPLNFILNRALQKIKVQNYAGAQ